MTEWHSLLAELITTLGSFFKRVFKNALLKSFGEFGILRAWATFRGPTIKLSAWNSNISICLSQLYAWHTDLSLVTSICDRNVMLTRKLWLALRIYKIILLNFRLNIKLLCNSYQQYPRNRKRSTIFSMFLSLKLFFYFNLWREPKM